MTAPALLALAHGSRDPRSSATIEAMTATVRDLRPDLQVATAYLDHCSPSPDEAFTALAARGVEEVVVVPLLLSEAYHARVDVPNVVAAAGERHPDLRVRAAAPLGTEAVLLEALDRRLRAALSRHKVRELDALILAAAGSSDSLANATMARLARRWGSHHRLPAVAAFASTTPPATGEAVRRFRSEGRRHIAVGSFFLAPGFLPDRAAELALEAGAVAVSEPLGDDEVVAQVALARYAVAAVELVPLPV